MASRNQPSGDPRSALATGLNAVPSAPFGRRPSASEIVRFLGAPGQTFMGRANG
jgi:hypothetical protein